MYCIKIAKLFSVILFVAVCLPVYSQNEIPAPSKFDMKKDEEKKELENSFKQHSW
jgi:hypothetical protein